MTIPELHNYLREIRDQSGAYFQILDLVDHLIRERGERPSLRHFDALIHANADAEHGSAEVVEDLLRECESEGIVGDGGFYHGVLLTLAVHPNHLLRAEVLQEMRERWIGVSDRGNAHLVVSHLRDREYEMALSLFYSLREKNTRVAPWIYDVMIYALAEAGEFDEAFRVLKAQAENPEANPLNPGQEDVAPGVWPYFMDMAAAAHHYPSVQYLWMKRVEVDFLRPSDGTLMSILDTAAAEGDAELATAALKMLSSRQGHYSISAYEALLDAYCTAGDLENAFRILGIMDKAAGSTSPKTDSSSTREIFAILKEAREADLKEAWRALRGIQLEGTAISTSAVNVVIEAAAMNGFVPLAFEFYVELKEAARQADPAVPTLPSLVTITPDTTTLNLLLQACSKTSSNGKGSGSGLTPLQLKDKAMFIASEFPSHGLRPSALTYDRLILVCVDQADYEDALRYVEEMENLGWTGKLRRGTWNALVKRMAREGDERVWDLLKAVEANGHRTPTMMRVVEELFGTGWGGLREEAHKNVGGDGAEIDVLDSREENHSTTDKAVDGKGHDDEADLPIWGSLRRRAQ